MTERRLRDALAAATRLAASAAAAPDPAAAAEAAREAARACGWAEARVALGPAAYEAARGETAVPIEAGGERLGTLVVSGDADGDDARVLGLLASQAALAILAARLREAAGGVDDATSLLDRRGFDEALRREVLRAYRTAAPLAAVVLEIDRFGSIVEPLGEQVARTVRRAVAGVMRRELRHADVAARTGSAQFRALLPGSGSDGAREVAERLRCAIAAARVPGAGTVTATFGVASMPEHAANGAGLVQAAEAAVATGTRRGRNCVVVALPIRQ